MSGENTHTKFGVSCEIVKGRSFLYFYLYIKPEDLKGRTTAKLEISISVYWGLYVLICKDRAKYQLPSYLRVYPDVTRCRSHLSYCVKN